MVGASARSTISMEEWRVGAVMASGMRHSAPAATAENLAKRKIRRKLGDYGLLWAVKYPPKPRGMWRRTYARHCAALDRIERTKLTPRRSDVR